MCVYGVYVCMHGHFVCVYVHRCVVCVVCMCVFEWVCGVCLCVGGGHSKALLLTSKPSGDWKAATGFHTRCSGRSNCDGTGSDRQETGMEAAAVEKHEAFVSAHRAACFLLNDARSLPTWWPAPLSLAVSGGWEVGDGMETTKAICSRPLHVSFLDCRMGAKHRTESFSFVFLTNCL